MHFRVILGLALCATLFSSCTPAFSVRLYNRSGRDVFVKRKDLRDIVLPEGKNAIVGSIHDWNGRNVVSLVFGDTVARYKVPELWGLPREAVRPMRFPAAAGSRECCLEVGEDFAIYAVHAKTLKRLLPQPAGFPIPPEELKTEPNQALQHNDPSCHVSCLRTPRASRGRG